VSLLTVLTNCSIKVWKWGLCQRILLQLIFRCYNSKSNLFSPNQLRLPLECMPLSIQFMGTASQHPGRIQGHGIRCWCSDAVTLSSTMRTGGFEQGSSALTSSTLKWLHRIQCGFKRVGLMGVSIDRRSSLSIILSVWVQRDSRV
jgi:hypothetical protein